MSSSPWGDLPSTYDVLGLESANLSNDCHGTQAMLSFRRGPKIHGFVSIKATKAGKIHETKSASASNHHDDHLRALTFRAEDLWLA